MGDRRGVALICTGCGGEIGGDGAERRRCACDEEHGRARAHVETTVLEFAPGRREREAN